jgi:hypothetical protein
MTIDFDIKYMCEGWLDVKYVRVVSPTVNAVKLLSKLIERELTLHEAVTISKELADTLTDECRRSTKYSFIYNHENINTAC